MSGKPDSPGFGQAPGTSSQFYEFPPGTNFALDSPTSSASSPCPDKPATPDPTVPRIQTSLKGIENAKKRLRAFSIQKKTPITPALPKAITGPGTSNTVLIGKLCSAKPPAPKPTIPDAEKVPKPPKPGKCTTYSALKKRTLEEIEDMKRKMELVELGIPLGLVLPPSNSDKGMPTKAMPPIKSFLDNEKVDELIREAKKAKAEGKEFKFDYQKLLPGYDNPFQRKLNDKQEEKAPVSREIPKSRYDTKKDRKHEGDRRRFDYKKEERDRSKPRDEADRERDYNQKKSRESEKREKDRSRDRPRDKEHARERDEKAAKSQDEERTTDCTIKKEKGVSETNVDLNDYLVCDSWSLDNETASPKVATDDTLKKIVAVKEEIEEAVKDPMEKYRETLEKKLEEKKRSKKVQEEQMQKMGKLQPVEDSFTYEIDPNDEALLDMFDEDSDIEKFSLPKKANKIIINIKKDLDLDSQDSKDSKDSKDASMDFLSEEFLESVIKEIKQEDDTDDDTSQDKGLVEYDMSPPKDDSQSYGTPESNVPRSGSTTPEIKTECSSQRSENSDNGYQDDESGRKSTESAYKANESGYKSTESGYKSTESGYKSTESGYKAEETGYKSTESVRSDDFDCTVDIENQLDAALKDSMSSGTMDALETWSFVMKICQPLLFRHDRNKCYRETKTVPKLWVTENPKRCDCVKDRTVVYEELEACKMALVDRVYGCDQMADYPTQTHRSWYPHMTQCLVATTGLKPLTSEWDLEDSSQNSEPPPKAGTPQGARRIAAADGDLTLDMEYQRFMQAVYPEVPDSKMESRSNTPMKEEASRKKKKKTEDDQEEKKPKKVKLSSEGWSLESDVEETDGKSKKKIDKGKTKKRKHSSSTISDSSDDDDERKSKKKTVKKSSKKLKTKAAKRRRLEKKYIKKLKAKQKEMSRKKQKKIKEKSEKIELDSDIEEDSEKIKKSKKKKQQKQKKKELKKKRAKSSSSSDSDSSSTDSESDSESEKESKKKKKREKKKSEEQRSRKKKEKKKKRKQSTSDSTQSDDLFDINILNNIKTEKGFEEGNKVTDLQDFSPRRQQAQPMQEIINVKELQNDLVTNNIHVKQEMLDEICKESADSKKDTSEFEEKEVTSERCERVNESAAAPDVASAEVCESKDFKEPNEQAKQIPPLKQLTEESNQSQASSQESTCSVKEQNYEKDESHLRPSSQNSNYSFHDVITASHSGWKGDAEEGDLNNYEMYERMAMEYQSGVANQQSTGPSTVESQSCRIETVVSRGCRGEIKCDWRPGDALPPPQRPSRWGLKPGDANIILTGSGAVTEPQVFPIRSVLEQDKVYPIESISSRGNDSGGGYDEAYADMYAASDRLQYGDCFTEPPPASERRSLDDRIEAVLSESAKDNGNVDAAVKGKSATEAPPPRVVKRVSFADGYKPGQDSDTEEPPVKKRKKRRVGCAWPCPAAHPDHVPLWDALPPPPPPPGSPPPPAPAPPLLLGRPPRVAPLGLAQLGLMAPMHHLHKYDASSMQGLLPPEQPPGMLGLPHMPM